MDKTTQIKELLNKGCRDEIYPGAVLLVALNGKIIFLQQAGHCFLPPPKVPMTSDTIFDLASLTKPLATTLALMKCVDDGKIDLDQTIENFLPISLSRGKKNLTPRLLLAHCAGFADWKPFYLDLVGPDAKTKKQILRKRIMEAPLAYEPGKETLYSDLGFIVLEWVVEECTGMLFSDFLYHSFYSPLSMKKTFFSGTIYSGRFEEGEIAATENCPWRKKVIQGAVHDENAHAVGGYSGHAGLFGTAGDIHILLDLLRSHFLGKRSDYLKPETVRTFFTRQELVAGSTWALGWDTPSPRNSSSGKYFSENTVGHLGYSGTSVWMDLEQDVIVIFLTNRIHPTRKNEKIKAFRPVLHDLVMKELILNGGN